MRNVIRTGLQVGECVETVRIGGCLLVNRDTVGGTCQEDEYAWNAGFPSIFDAVAVGIDVSKTAYRLERRHVGTIGGSIVRGGGFIGRTDRYRIANGRVVRHVIANSSGNCNCRRGSAASEAMVPLTEPLLFVNVPLVLVAETNVS